VKILGLHGNGQSPGGWRLPQGYPPQTWCDPLKISTKKDVKWYILNLMWQLNFNISDSFDELWVELIVGNNGCDYVCNYTLRGEISSCMAPK